MSLLKIKKGDSVILKSFTGVAMGVFTVESSDEKKVTILKKDGSKGVFSRKTGKQTNVEEGKERYASTIIEDDGSYKSIRPSDDPKKSAKKKETPKKKKPEPEDDDEDDEDEEDEKPAPKKSSKKKKAEQESEPEDDEDDLYEEVDEDEDDEPKPAKKAKKKTK